MAHKLSSACAEIILSYHLLAQQIFFTHNWNLSRHCFVVCVCLLFVCFVFCFCFCVVVAFVVLCFVSCFLMNVTVHRTMYWSSTNLLLRPLQHRPLRDLINQLIPYATCFETC